MTSDNACERLATMFTDWVLADPEIRPGEVVGMLVAVIEVIVRETCGPDEAEIQDTIDAVCYALQSYSARQKSEAA